MLIRHLSVERFRGIRSLEWDVPPGMTCLIGPGDTGKSSILEAIELVLWPRGFLQLTEADFFQTDTTKPIVMSVTVTDIPKPLLRQEKFGMELRGWNPRTGLVDEPDDEAEDALTIRLRIDSSLDPEWVVVNERKPDGRPISARDREFLSPVRLGADVDRQLAWARGTALNRLSGDPSEVSQLVSDALRHARHAVTKVDFSQLADLANEVGELGRSLGANLPSNLSVGADVRALSLSSAGLVLQQQDQVPASNLGLGSRRLIALAIQAHAAREGAVRLIDELEAGLEPHRVRHLLRELVVSEDENQIVATTHSDAAIAELGSPRLALVRTSADRELKIIQPSSKLQGLIRTHPGALLCRRVVVCEGATELGISIELESLWAERREAPLASLGVLFVDGKGNANAASRAAELSELQHEVCVWADSDQPLNPTANELLSLGVHVIVWDGSVCTEERITKDLPARALEDYWMLGVETQGRDTVNDQLVSAMDHTGTRPNDWEGWTGEYDETALRDGLALASTRSRWFKSVEGGRSLGRLLCRELLGLGDTDLFAKVADLETWCYGE